MNHIIRQIGKVPYGEIEADTECICNLCASPD